MAAVVATAAQRLCVSILMLECAALIGLAIAASIPSEVQRDLIYAAAAIAGASAAVHAIGWLTVYSRSLLGVRFFLMLSVAVAAACALFQSELRLIHGSQEELRGALQGRGSRCNLTEIERDEVLDGGEAPSLIQRFLFDGPAWLLSRLEKSCAADSSSSTEPEAFAGSEPYTLQWDFQNTTCVDELLGANMDAEAAAQIAVALFLAALAIQMVLTSIILLIADPETFKRRETQRNMRSGRRTRRQKRKGSRSAGKSTSAHGQALHRLWDGSVQLLALTIAIMASTMATVSWRLLDSCSFDPSVVDHWLLGLALGSGLLTVVGLVLVRFSSKAWLSCCALSCGIAFSIYALNELAGLPGVLPSHSDGARLFIPQFDQASLLPQLKTWYDEASRQHCSIVTHWLSHICTPAEATTTNEAVGAAVLVPGTQLKEEKTMRWDTTCQHEFATLLANTVAVLSQYLAVLLVLELMLLALVAFPVLYRLISWLWGGCCFQWRRCWSRWARPAVSSPRSSQADQPLVAGKLLQQSSLEYLDALRLYLSSVRSTDETVREAERAAFEKEWARKTRRHPVSAPQSSTSVAASSWLPSYRTMATTSNSSATEGIMIAERDFEAIVRTLVIRRLVTRCKMDVSVSLSSDGQLLFVQLSASDNVLMTRLCDLDEYELQFADAIDPGRSFWQQRDEMERDLKVLESHEVKQQFKLLLCDKSAESSGSTGPGRLSTIQEIQRQDAEWFPGETLIQVSARIHALHRISRFARGELPRPSATDWYHAAARVRYSPRPQLQFLYKKYLNKLDAATGVVRRASALRTVDCLRITRLLLDEEFDVDAMLESGLLASFQCLHSASRMDFNSRTALASSWIAFWRRPSREATSASLNKKEKATELALHHRRMWWGYWCCCQWVTDLTNEISSAFARWAPHRQPIQDIHDYFGECIAFYVAWIGLYVQLMILPALVVAAVAAYATVVNETPQDGMLLLLWNFYRAPAPVHEGGEDAGDTATSSVGQLGAFYAGLGVVMTLWALVFAKMWERQTVWYHLKWGSTSSTSSSRSPGNVDNGEYDLSLLPGSQMGHRIASWCCVALLICCNAAVVLVLVLAQGYAFSTGWVRDVRVTVVMSCACQAALIQWFGGNNGGGRGAGGNESIVSRLAIHLSKWENHQDDDAFQRAMILKLFVLELANSLTGLLLLLMLGIRVDDGAPSSSSLLLLRLLLRLPSLGLLGGHRGISWLHTLASDYEREIAPITDTFVQIQTLLAFTFLARIGVRALTLVGHASAIATTLDQHSQSENSGGKDLQQKARAATLAPSASVEAEHELRVYSGVAGGYADVMAQLALVSMFSSVLPIAPLLALIDAALALRVNAVELSCLTRRPEPEACAGVGLWSDCVRVVTKLVAATTIALVGFRPSWSSPLSELVLMKRASTFLISVACCWLVIEVLWLAVPNESGRLQQIRRRRAFLVQRYMFGDDDGDSGDKPKNGRSDRDNKSSRAKRETIGEKEVGELLAEAGEQQGPTDTETTLENVRAGGAAAAAERGDGTAQRADARCVRVTFGFLNSSGASRATSDSTDSDVGADRATDNSPDVGAIGRGRARPCYHS